MFIHIYDWGDYTWDSCYESEIGLKLVKYGRVEVINKPLFMLAVIKYAIEFKEVKF